MDTCDNCGCVADLYHNDKYGLSFCEDCDIAADDQPEISLSKEELRFIRLISKYFKQEKGSL